MRLWDEGAGQCLRRALGGAARTVCQHCCSPGPATKFLHISGSILHRETQKIHLSEAQIKQKCQDRKGAEHSPTRGNRVSKFTSAKDWRRHAKGSLHKNPGFSSASLCKTSHLKQKPRAKLIKRIWMLGVEWGEWGKEGWGLCSLLNLV